MEVRETKIVTKEVVETTDLYSECDKYRTRIREGLYERFECEIVLIEGKVYPENLDLEETTIELCQKCGKELIEFLESQGYRINRRSIS